MDNYRHYVTADASGYVLAGFVEDGYHFAAETDHYIGEGIRQFQLQLRDFAGVPLYMWDGTLRECTAAERQAWIDALPAAPPTQEQRIAAMEMALLDVILGV